MMRRDGIYEREIEEAVNHCAMCILTRLVKENGLFRRCYGVLEE
jgi:hypothetical protein